MNYAVTSATASGSDFTSGVLPSGQMSFGAGVASQTLTINVSGDTTVETDEPFTVTLSNPSAGALVQATAHGGSCQIVNMTGAVVTFIATATIDRIGSKPLTLPAKGTATLMRMATADAYLLTGEMA